MTGGEWRSWLAAIVAREEVLLGEEQARLEGIRSGRRFKPRNMSLGWTDRLAAQTAYVRAIQRWIICLRDPDMWLLAFLDRGDFGSYSWRWGFGDRRTQFFRKHAGNLPGSAPARSTRRNAGRLPLATSRNRNARQGRSTGRLFTSETPGYAGSVVTAFRPTTSTSTTSIPEVRTA